VLFSDQIIFVIQNCTIFLFSFSSHTLSLLFSMKYQCVLFIVLYELHCGKLYFTTLTFVFKEIRKRNLINPYYLRRVRGKGKIGIFMYDVIDYWVIGFYMPSYDDVSLTSLFHACTGRAFF